MSGSEFTNDHQEKAMRKVYLSFLGTNNYLPCNYICEPHDPVNNVRFVQEATISWYCRGWKDEDEVLIFSTEEACQNNWLDNGHKDKNGNVVTCEGLKTRLANLSSLVKKVAIPSGKDEQEIWGIFSTIVNQLEEEDELYLDITHAFRSLPLLAIVIINYAKIIKNIRVKAINYGAMEAVGSAGEVGRMDIEQRNIPVFDLLPFETLLDWSTAIDKFLSSGDASGVRKLTVEKSRARKKELKRADEEADGLKKMVQHLGTFSETLATCRGRSINQNVTALKDSIRSVLDQTLIFPLSPLLTKLQDGIAEFPGEEVGDGLAAAGWCLQHNLTQQGFTILQETMFTFILARSTGVDTSLIDNRNLVGKAIAIELDGLPFEDWDKTARENKKMVNRICQWLHPRKRLLENLKNLSANRNDLNHAGMNDNPMAPDKFRVKLSEYLDVFSKEIS